MTNFLFKKGSNLKCLLRFSRLLPFFIATSCILDPTSHGRVVKRNSIDKNLFIFSVKQEYVTKHKDSPQDKKNPKITKAESRLLVKLLDLANYCINEEGDVVFRITSKQEKIYDMTYASLIEESYHARPLTPLMYYGQCLNRSNLIDKERVLKTIKDEVGKLN